MALSLLFASRQTNYLTHFLLVRLLLPFLSLADAPRIIFVSSNAASWGHVSLTNLNAEEVPESSWRGMGRFKTCVLPRSPSQPTADACAMKAGCRCTATRSSSRCSGRGSSSADCSQQSRTAKIRKVEAAT